MRGSSRTRYRVSLRGFPPVIDPRVTTLILGSFPSERSLAKGQYYAHPQNQFWRLVGRIVGEPLHEMRYEGRLDALLRHHIGLWDVLESCRRRGSLDSAIRDATHNQFERVTRVTGRLCRVCFNGKAAGQLEPYFAEQGYETFVMPSSSPANTVPISIKLRAWRRALTVRTGTVRKMAGHRSRVTGHPFQC